MGISERRQRYKEQVRLTILETAWQIVVNQGWGSLSIRNIAEAIEFSAPVIYSHFENKEAILMEFYKQGFALLAGKLEEAKSVSSDPEKQLQVAALAYLNFAFQNKEYYQLMYGINIECCSKGVCEATSGVKMFFNNIIEEILRQNNNQNSDLFLKRVALWSLLHGLVSISFTRKLKEEGKAELVLEDAIKGFIKSLKN